MSENKKRAYVTVCTSNYHYLAIHLAKSISEFSKYKLHVFCVNYDPHLENMSIPEDVFFHKISYTLDEEGQATQIASNGNIYVVRENIRSFQITSRKSEACIKMIDLGFDEICYIDCDSLVTPIIDELFYWGDRIKNVPLMSEGPHEFVMVKDRTGKIRGNPFENVWPDKDLTLTLEWPLMQFMGVGVEKRTVYRTSNLFIFNKNCLDFLQTLEQFCNVLWKVADPFYYAPFQDETPMNVLVWKNSGEGLPMIYINVEGFLTVEHFYNTEVSNDTLFGDFYLIPKEKRNVKVIHGEKRSAEIEKILSYLIKLKENDYFNV
jgi:hypothetical protein